MSQVNLDWDQKFTMYCDFYHFKENPFHLTPDPRFFFLAESHEEALASILYGICERKGYICIIGGFGMGKTTLIRRALEELEVRKVRAVFLPGATFSIEEILRKIVRDLEIPPGDGKKSSLVRKLNEFLLERLPREENLALLIDEAQELDREVMEELRLLSNLETSSAKLLQIVLVGEPELDVKLNSPGLRQFRQRIVIRREIKPLTPEESREYIEHRLGLVGSSTSGIFYPQAVGSICKNSKGIPRDINMICDNALRIGHSLGQKKIDEKIVNEAIRMGRQPGGETPIRVKPLLTDDAQAGGPRRAGPSEIVDGASVKSPEPPGPISYRVGTAEKPEEWKAVPSSRGKFSAHKRPLVLFCGLGCLLLVFFLGRGYLNQTVENRGAAAPKIEPEKPAVTQTAPGPPSGINPQSASIAGPIQKTDEPKPVSAKIAPIPPASSASTVPRRPEILTVVVQNGDTVSNLSRKYYRMTSATLLDKILEFNPGITNLHRIRLSQKIKIPKITEADFLIPASDGTWKIHVGTFSRPGQGDIYRNEPGLKGKSIEVVPRKVAPGETWYRMFAGKFKTKAEALKVVRVLKEEGKLAIP